MVLKCLLYIKSGRRLIFVWPDRTWKKAMRQKAQSWYSEWQPYLPEPLNDRMVWTVSILVDGVLSPVVDIHITKATHEQLWMNEIVAWWANDTCRVLCFLLFHYPSPLYWDDTARVWGIGIFLCSHIYAQCLINLLWKSLPHAVQI